MNWETINRLLRYLQQGLEVSNRYRLLITQSFHLTAIASIYRQQEKIEESLKLLRQSEDVCRKSGYADGLVRSLRMTAEVMVYGKRDEEAIPYFEEAGELFLKLKDRQNAALMFGNLASIHEEANRLPGAVRAWERIRDISKELNDLEGLISALEALGRFSRQQGDYSSSIAFYSEALQLAVKPETQAALRNTLGILEWMKGDFAAALQHYQLALEIFQRTGDEVHASLMLNSIGVTLKKLGEVEQAASALKRAVDLNRKTNEVLLEGHSLSALGEIFFESGQLGDAAECFRNSLAIRKEIGDRKGEGWMLYQLARVYESQNLDSLSRQSVAEAARIAGEIADEELDLACENVKSTLSDKSGV